MLFYQVVIRVLRLIISVASIFNPKAKLWIKGRKNWPAQLANLNPSKKTIWFHTASLGEYEQASPIIEAYKAIEPDVQVLVSFFSPSGYEVRKNDPLADVVCYLPLDTKKNAKLFLAIVKPCLAVFIRYEFWPSFLDQLYKQKIPTAVVSAHFRRNQTLFKPIGIFMKKRLLRLNKILVQYPDSRKILMDNGFSENSVSVCGDSRIDRVIEISSTPLENSILTHFTDNKKVLVLGSSYTDEESFTFPLMEKEKGLKIIIAPHYVDENNINQIIGSTPVSSVRYTQAKENDELKNAQVLILDTMGMLAAIYKFGHFALVGGGFKDGIHSILEPAAYGLPLFFGPDHLSFTEAKGVISSGGGFEVNNQEEFLDSFLPLYKDEALRKKTGNQVLEFLNTHKGASSKIAKELTQLAI